LPTSIESSVNKICDEWQKRQGALSIVFPIEGKTIQDPIHGPIEIEPELVFLLDSVMMQRLRRISQLGLANLVFPGANHTRLEHSLGVMHIVGRILARIKKDQRLNDNDILEAKAAALLHDIGHLPFSHVPEPLLALNSSIRKESQAENIKPSELLTTKIIQSDLMKSIFEILNKKSKTSHLDAKNVASQAVGNAPLNNPQRMFLGEISHGDFDADRMDYLMRDAHYSGCPLGTLDVERLVRATTVSKGSGGIKSLAMDIKGLHALESMIVARSVMYSVVYFHHAVRAANGMLLRAIHSKFKTNPLNLLRYDDHSLISYIRTDPEAGQFVEKLESRALFKTSVRLTTKDALNQPALMDFVNKANIGSVVADEGSINKKVRNDNRKHCIIDMPPIEIYSEIDFNIREILPKGEKVNPIRSYSSIAKGVEDDAELKWRGYVFGPQAEVKKVRETALDYLQSKGLSFNL